MGTIQLADIPAPRLKDKEYMQVCHKYLQARQENYALERERDAWCRAFWGAYAVLIAVVFVLIAFAATKLMN